MISYLFGRRIIWKKGIEAIYFREEMGSAMEGFSLKEESAREDANCGMVIMELRGWRSLGS